MQRHRFGEVDLGGGREGAEPVGVGQFENGWWRREKDAAGDRGFDRPLGPCETAGRNDGAGESLRRIDPILGLSERVPIGADAAKVGIAEAVDRHDWVPCVSGIVGGGADGTADQEEGAFRGITGRPGGVGATGHRVGGAGKGGNRGSAMR